MKKKVLKSMFMLLLCLLSVTAYAGRRTENVFCCDSVYYYIEEGAAIVTYKGDFYDSYNEYSGDIVIPSKVNGFDVVWN